MEDQQKPTGNQVVRILIGFAVFMFISQLIGGKKRGKRKATLKSSSLRGVDLSRIKLPGAKVINCDLSQANLSYADLSDALLRNVNLKETSLREADLEGADLQKPRFSKKTTLPDGNGWTRDVDMARFTDHDHPEFWRSADQESPAFAE